MSEILMALREIYKNGRYVVQVRGLITLLKILVLLTISLLHEYTFIILSTVLFLGVTASHLPKKVKKKCLINV